MQSVNYENGTSDKFVSPNCNPNIITNESATQYSDDKQLLQMYNSDKNYETKAKTLKLIAWIGAPIIIIGGTIAINQLMTGDWIGDETNYTSIPIGIVAGAAWWSAFYFPAIHLKKLSQYSVQSSPLYKQEFKVGKSDRLIVGVDMLKDNTYKHQTLGLGLAYNF